MVLFSFKFASVIGDPLIFLVISYLLCYIYGRLVNLEFGAINLIQSLKQNNQTLTLEAVLSP